MGQIVPKQIPEKETQDTDVLIHFDENSTPTKCLLQCLNGSEKGNVMDNTLITENGMGRTTLLGNDSCVEPLISQGFSTAADRHLVDVIRDSANRTQSIVQDSSSLALVAIERVAAAAALATLGAELRLGQQIMKEGCETRALINSVDAARIRDDLSEARAELLALRTRITSTV